MDNLPLDTSHKFLKERLIFDNETYEKIESPSFRRINESKIIPSVLDNRTEIITTSVNEVDTSPNSVYAVDLPQVYAETYRKFVNHSNEPYIDFEFDLLSKIYVPHWNDYSIYLDDVKIELAKDTSKPTFTATYNESNPSNNAPPICVRESFLVPFQVNSGEDVDFRIYYRTPSYLNALIGQTDEITFEITRPTDILEFEIVLDGKMAEFYKFTKCITRDSRYPRKPSQEISGEDKSNQRMFDIEDNIEKPTWNNDKITWIINRPKISYSYSLFFRILPK